MPTTVTTTPAASMVFATASMTSRKVMAHSALIAAVALRHGAQLSGPCFPTSRQQFTPPGQRGDIDQDRTYNSSAVSSEAQTLGDPHSRDGTHEKHRVHGELARLEVRQRAPSRRYARLADVAEATQMRRYASLEAHT